MNKLISIVVPVYNEAGNIEPLVSEIQKVFEALQQYDYEILFVNDGSKDRSYDVVVELSKDNKNIKLIDLSKNFGNQIAVSAGMEHATGDAVITMDADLQHPPSVITKLIKEWEKGFEVVVAKRKGWEHAFGSRLFFILLSFFSDIKLNYQISDLRLLDRIAIEAFCRFSERQRFVRGMVQWLGFRQSEIDYEVSKRGAGKSSFSFLGLIKLAITSFTSFSLVPLKVALIVGFMIFMGSIFLLLYMAINYYFISPGIFRPIAFFAVLNATLSGFILICLGLVASYVGKVYREVIGRPIYIVREKINFVDRK